MTNASPMSPMSPVELVEAAEQLAPLLQEKAREAEIARRPLDQVIDAIAESGLFALMVPRCHGGHEADLDTFFEVVLRLSQADASMGWLTAFYIEHSYWFCGFPEDFQKQLFADRPFALAPGSLSMAGGSADEVPGGYRLTGRWQWGTGIVHADWVMVGAMKIDAEGNLAPRFFAVPRDEVEAIDTWHVAGMCATGSYDLEIGEAFVPENRSVDMLGLINATAASEFHDGPLYRPPLVPILGFASALPMLGAARGALDAYRAHMTAKIEANEGRAGGLMTDDGKPAVVAEAALSIDAAELVLRDVLRDVMDQRNAASTATRGTWLSRMAHAVFMCRSAVQDILSVTGAGGSRLDSPIQRAMRDISTGSNHIIFDRETRYADFGRTLLDQPIQSFLV